MDHYKLVQTFSRVSDFSVSRQNRTVGTGTWHAFLYMTLCFFIFEVQICLFKSSVSNPDPDSIAFQIRIRNAVISQLEH